MFAKTALLLLVISFLFLPLGWKTLRGPSVRHYQVISKTLFAEKELPLCSSVNESLSQSYYYWNKGRECDAFLSQDGRFVLKIPRPKRFRSPRSFQIAMKVFASETALLYAHYGYQERPFPDGLALHDRLKRRLKLDLSHCPFVLQRRVGLLKTALEESGREESKNLLIQFLGLISLEKERGWACTDFSFATNFGVIEGGKVVRIDIGGYEVVNSNFSWKKTVKPVCRYLKDKDPELLQFFIEKVEFLERQGALGQSMNESSK